jgi:hypothetical protein
MIPDEPISTDSSSGDMDAYLIELRSIGGLSGSPVFVRQMIGMEFGPLLIGTFFLLGLVHGHWNLPSGEMDEEIDRQDSANRSINMGIGIVVPAKKILEVLNQPGLLEMRRQTDEKIRQENLPTLDEGLEQESSKTFTEQDFEDALRRASRRIEPSEPGEESSQT